MHANKEEQRRKKQSMLSSAIHKSLLSLGEPIMKTILWHLQLRGFSLNTNNQDIDVNMFYNYLNEIVGNLADVITEDVYSNLQTNFVRGSSGQSSSVLLTNSHAELQKTYDAFSDDTSPSDRIQFLLDLGSNDNGGDYSTDTGTKGDYKK